MRLSQLSIHHHGIKVVIQKLITHLTFQDDDHADFNETEILYDPASQNMYDSPAHDPITKSPPPTSIRLSIKKIMKTSEKEKVVSLVYIRM